MKNLVRLSLYGWLVQVVLRKMKEEQGEDVNERFFGHLRDHQMMENLVIVPLCVAGCRW